MPVTLKIGQCSLLGNYRENNEDAVDVKEFPDMTIAIVADGMGGQNAGEVASKRATEIIPRELKKHITGIVSNDETRNIIRLAIVQANQDILSLASLDRELKNMGTTVVAALCCKGSAVMYITGLGDSRIYQLRGKKLAQLTVDHSIAEALVEAGTISKEEARTHRYRNVLWKYLGSNEVGEGPEVQVVNLKVGDRYVLCTDGVCGPVTDDEILSYVQNQNDMQACAEGLCQLALDNGSKDNVSCVTIEVIEQG